VPWTRYADFKKGIGKAGEGFRMKKVFQYSLAVVLLIVALYCVSAAASIASAPAMVKHTLTEPINMLLVGFGMIGFGSFIKRKTLK
jgi:hypothetical protein